MREKRNKDSLRQDNYIIGLGYSTIFKP